MSGEAAHITARGDFTTAAELKTSAGDVALSGTLSFTNMVASSGQKSWKNEAADATVTGLELQGLNLDGTLDYYPVLDIDPDVLVPTNYTFVLGTVTITINQGT